MALIQPPPPATIAAATRLLSAGVIRRSSQSLNLLNQEKEVLKLIPIITSAAKIAGESEKLVKKNKDNFVSSQLRKKSELPFPLLQNGASHSFRRQREKAPKHAKKSLIEALEGPESEKRTVRLRKAIGDGLSKQASSASPKYNLNTAPKSDLIVVLDMDECLVHSQFLASDSDAYRQEEDRPTQVASTNCESFRVTLPGGDLVHVNKRPNLDKFLASVTARYETHIFTAAMEVYANPVLDVLDPNNNMLQQRFYRESCKLDPDFGVYVKDLSHVLNKSLCPPKVNQGRVVLVDNNPLSFLANPSNGILVSSFYDDPNDDTLPTVLDLLNDLDSMEDVRPALEHLFGLERALNDALHFGKR